MLKLEKFLTLFIGIGAVAGAAMMWIDPTGIPSGFVLLFLNGLSQFAAAYLLFKKHSLAQWAVFAGGIILMLWIVLEWWVWGFNAMSNIYFVLGLVEAVAAGVNLKIKKEVK